MGIWFEKILDSIYPRIKFCVSCLKKLEDGFMCEECLRDVSFNNFFDKKRFENFNASYVCFYRGSIKNVIYNFKVYKKFYCGEYLGNILADYIEQSGEKIDYLTYVPRDSNKIKVEGFDQSYFLTKIVSERLEIPIVKILYCKGKKYDQKKMDSKNRILNIRGKFFLRNDLNNLKNKNLLMIDDVATTYSTLKEVSKVIVNSNDKINLSVLTIAKTLI